jgi:hypothetical protein
MAFAEPLAKMQEKYDLTKAVIEDSDVKATALQWAEDTVTTQDAVEFSQKWLGETIVSSHEILQEHVIKLCDEDNDYCTGKFGKEPWSDAKKIEAFVTPIGYKEEK